MKNNKLVIGFGVIVLVAITLFMTFHSVPDAKAQPIPVTGAGNLSLRQEEEFLHSSNAIPLPQNGNGLNNVPAELNPSYLLLRHAWEYVHSFDVTENTYGPDYLKLRQAWEFVRNSK